MKRYLLFAGPIYYPSGGWGDFHNSYDTYEDAINAAYGVGAVMWEMWGSYWWYHIVDSQTGQIIKQEDGEDFVERKQTS